MIPITVPVVERLATTSRAPPRPPNQTIPSTANRDPLAGAGAPEVAHLHARCRLCHRGRPAAEASVWSD